MEFKLRDCPQVSSLNDFNNGVHIIKFSVPPEWIVKPADQAAVEGQDVVFQCRVAGIPLPTITWRKLDKSELPFQAISMLDKLLD